jgi:hypothetical protein
MKSKTTNVKKDEILRNTDSFCEVKDCPWLNPQSHRCSIISLHHLQNIGLEGIADDVPRTKGNVENIMVSERI